MEGREAGGSGDVTAQVFFGKSRWKRPVIYMDALTLRKNRVCKKEGKSLSQLQYLLNLHVTHLSRLHSLGLQSQ